MLGRNPPSLWVQQEPSELVGSHQPSQATCLVGTLPGLWVMETLLDLWEETNLVPKLRCLTLIL